VHWKIFAILAKELLIQLLMGDYRMSESFHLKVQFAFGKQMHILRIQLLIVVAAQGQSTAQHEK
jgi:hypothetical protein